MIIIVGNRHFTHHRGRTEEVITCPSCGHSLNFVFPYRFKRQVECPFCRTALRVDRAQYDAFLRTRKRDRIRKL